MARGKPAADVSPEEYSAAQEAELAERQAAIEAAEAQLAKREAELKALEADFEEAKADVLAAGRKPGKQGATGCQAREGAMEQQDPNRVNPDLAA